MNIKNAVKILMLENGISAVQIAKSSGLTRQGIYKIVKPDANPKLDTLSRLAQALKVPLSELIRKAEQLDYDAND